MTETLGVFRRCGRCLEWLNIDRFKGIERLCMDCRRWDHPKRIGPQLIRTLTITEKGRAYLREERAAG